MPCRKHAEEGEGGWPSPYVWGFKFAAKSQNEHGVCDSYKRLQSHVFEMLKSKHSSITWANKFALFSSVMKTDCLLKQTNKVWPVSLLVI